VTHGPRRVTSLCVRPTRRDRKPELPGVVASVDPSHLDPTDRPHVMRIHLTLGDLRVDATLEDNATAADFADLLPLAVRLTIDRTRP